MVCPGYRIATDGDLADMPWRQVTSPSSTMRLHAGYGGRQLHLLDAGVWLGDRRNLLVIEDVAIDSFYLYSLAQRRERHSERGFGHPITVDQGGILGQSVAPDR